MRVDPAEVLRIAALAHLEVSPAETPALAKELSGILEYIDQLRGVEVDGEFDAASAPEPAPLRDDEPGSVVSRTLIEGNAPAWADGFFVVPRVIGSE